MMTFEDVAHLVLEQAGEPLHYREIARRALKRGLLDRSLRTPSAALHAHLAVDILAYGHVSRFQRTPDGAFALRTWGLPEGSTRGRARRARRAPQRAPAPAPQPTHLPLPDAIERVLRATPHGGPLDAAEIVARAQAQGWLPGGQQVPLVTVAAAISTDNRRRIERGKAPRFIAHGQGSYSLAGTGEERGDVAAHNGTVRRALVAQLQAMSAGDFALLLQHLLRALGFTRVEIVHVGPQEMIQLVGEFLIAGALRTEITIHAYAGKERQSAAAVKTVRQMLPPYGQGLVITAGDFSLVACAEAARPDAAPVGLLSAYDLVTLMANRGIGVAQAVDGRLALAEVRSGSPN